MAIKVGFVVHVMNVAGAEVLVAETIRRLVGRIQPVVFCLDQVGTIGERLQAGGTDVIAFNRRPGLDFSLSWRMARQIRSRGVEVVHAHQYTPFFYASVAARLSGTHPRVIFTEHGRHYPDVVSTKRRLLNRWVFDRFADDVNAVCEFSARSLSDNDGFAAGRIAVIPNGVDLARYAQADKLAIKQRLGLDATRRHIVTIARLHPVKDHRTLIQAFALAADRIPDVDLLLVGDGSLRTELERLCGDLGVKPRVAFLGIRNDVADILRAADMFALTSLSEAASITLLEAMASELPVVVTAVGGNPEIVRDGLDGVLTPRGDSRAIASALVDVLTDRTRAEAMGRSAGERVRTTFRLETTIERYYALYAAANKAGARTEAA